MARRVRDWSKLEQLALDLEGMFLPSSLLSGDTMPIVSPMSRPRGIETSNSLSL